MSGVSATNIAHEHRTARAHSGLTAEQLDAIATNAFDATFVATQDVGPRSSGRGGSPTVF
jgi:hypothetical protein